MNDGQGEDRSVGPGLVEVSARVVINDHIREKCELLEKHRDTVNGHINAERALTNDYMGRAIYELLQNAVDRAEQCIWITLDESRRSLSVANDGRPLGLVREQDQELSDFEALCSIHTSNKHPGGSIGNKGVGFKSIWEFCSSVQIRSRYQDKKTPWGFRLRFPFRSDHLADWGDREMVGIVEKALQNSELLKKNEHQAPSFYFPEFIEDPDWHHDEAVTAIELENIEEGLFERLKKLVEEIAKSPLMFVSSIRPEHKLMLHPSSDGQQKPPKQLFVDDSDWLTLPVNLDDLEEQLAKEMKNLGFELQDKDGVPRAAKVSIIVPTKTESNVSGYIHSYLPTEMKTGAPLHIQGDFYLNESRKGIDFKNNKYNKLLLERIVDTLLEGIETNVLGVAGKPYVFELLTKKGPVGELVSNRLEGKGGALGNIFLGILKAISEEEKTLNLYGEFFHQIQRFKPPKVHHYYDAHENYTLNPYLTAFCREDLCIVPLEYDVKDVGERAGVVKKSCPLPDPKKKGVLFSRPQDDSASLEAVDLPEITITPWSMSTLSVGEDMRKARIWRKYERAALFRQIARVQKETASDSYRRDLLATALRLVLLKEAQPRRTHWQFIEKEVHPSARLRVPVLGEHQWAEARYAFLPDEHGLLEKHVDTGLVHQIDLDRCKDLGVSQLLTRLCEIGVWDCIPLVKEKQGRQWKMAISSIPSDLNSLSFVSRSYWIWRAAENQNIDGIIRQLTDSSWLNLASKTADPVAPSSSFLGIPGVRHSGFSVINADRLDDEERDFLRVLGMRRLDETNDVQKLIRACKLLVPASSGPKDLRTDTLKSYRRILKRINQLVRKDEGELDAALNTLPLLYEETGNQRGIAGSGDTVWYVPGSQSKAKARMTLSATKWWLAKRDVGNLANRLVSVSTLDAKQELIVEGKKEYDQDCYAGLEEYYLPRFLALVIYGDIGGISNIDEDAIQERWQALTVYRVDGATLTEHVEGMGDPYTIEVKDTGLLWESKSLEQAKKSGELYVSGTVSFDDPKTIKSLCQWFAEEIFRQRDLAIYLEKLVDSDLGEFGVSGADLEESQSQVSGWLPNTLLDQLIGKLRQWISFSGGPITRENWRDPAFYESCELRFDELKQNLGDEFGGYIQSLDPSRGNKERLEKFLEAHRDEVAALPQDEAQKSPDWLAKFENDVKRFTFDFVPLNWLISKAEITEKDFIDLKGNLRGMEKELEKAEGANTTPIAASPSKAKFKASSVVPKVAGVGLKDVVSDDERASRNLSVSRSGKNTERRVAIEAAKRAISMDAEQASGYFSLLKQEYIRLKKSKEFSDNQPRTEREWLKVLHIGRRWDGAGYDVLDFDLSEKKLLLIEVKSSRSVPAEIHFSEPERKKIISLSSVEFSENYPRRIWKLYLGTIDSYVDITKDFQDVLIQHDQQLSAVMDNPIPESWILRKIQLEKS